MARDPTRTELAALLAHAVKHRARVMLTTRQSRALLKLVLGYEELRVGLVEHHALPQPPMFVGDTCPICARLEKL